jgi:hypothetical protein
MAMIRLLIVFTQQPPAVLVFVTVNAEVFPVAAVGGIVVMISVPVMNREEMPVCPVKFPSASGTDQTVDTQRPFAVIRSRGFPAVFLDLPDNVFNRPHRL